MEKACVTPPDSCVMIEMEPGIYLGYRKAVLLNEIEALGSLEKAAKTSRVGLQHARDLINEMNNSFSRPLIRFTGKVYDCDQIQLTKYGQSVARSYWRQFEPVWL
ncbi:winged helix-turn-helix domain-containing protein [Desulfocastanea catecholica]